MHIQNMSMKSIAGLFTERIEQLEHEVAGLIVSDLIEIKKGENPNA